MSAKAGWYPDPGGGHGLYRYWDGKAWSAATSPNPSAAPPSLGLVGGAGLPGQQAGTPGSTGYGTSGSTGYGGTYGSTGNPGAYGSTGSQGQRTAGAPGRGHPGAGQPGPGHPGAGQPGYGAYTHYQQVSKKKSAAGWWVAGAALVVAIVVVAVIAIRAFTGDDAGVSGVPGGQASQDVCPRPKTDTASPGSHPNDGRVHGGPVSYPLLGPPWSDPRGDERVPFGSDVQSQTVGVETNYDGAGSDWVASVLVGELQAGDGFFTPEQGSQIVVKCILGKFYGDNPVTSNVTVNKAMTIDGHEGWLVESKLSFDIAGLQTKGELLIVAIVSAGNRSGLYYASIPNTTPQLVQPARDALAALQVEG